MNPRRWAADRLIRIAYRLDPTRPAACRTTDGGWLVTLGAGPLARIRVENGQVRS